MMCAIFVFCILVNILKTRIIALSVREVGYFHIGVFFFLSGHLFLSAPDGTSQLILDGSHFNQQPANVEGAAVSEKPSTQQVLYFFRRNEHTSLSDKLLLNYCLLSASFHQHKL